MRLMTKEILKKLPPIYSTQDEGTFDDVLVLFKYYILGMIWYVIEGEQMPNGDVEFYGYVENQFDKECSEWGIFCLSQLEMTMFGMMKVQIELLPEPIKFGYFRKKHNLY